MTFRYCFAEANALFFPAKVLPESAAGTDMLGLLDAVAVDSV